MKKIPFIFRRFSIMLIFCCSCITLSCKNTDINEYIQKSGDEKSIVALNYCAFSLAKINKYDDRTILDNEYENITNSISLKDISNKNVVSIIQQLMDTLTDFQLSKIEKEKFENDVNRIQEKLILRLISGYSTGIGVGLIAEAVGIESIPFVIAAGIVTSMIHATQLDDIIDKRDDHTWKMKQDAIRAINELKKSFMASYWAILQGSNVPEAWRVTDSQLEAMLEAAKETDPTVRHRVLSRLEKECGFIPAYWHDRAAAALSALEKGESGNFAADITFCLERYDSFVRFLRKDALRANLLMFHLASTRLPPTEARHHLSSIVEPFPNDASKRLFAAQICMQYGFYNEAVEHLQANIDRKQLNIASRTLLAEVYEKQKNTDAQITLLQKLSEDESVSNQEILFQLGKISETEQFLKRIAPEISGITLRVESTLYGQDNILLALPERWLLAEDAIGLTSLHVGAHKMTPTTLEKDNKNVTIIFEKVVNLKEMLKGGVCPVKVELLTSDFPVTVFGRFEPVAQPPKNTIGEMAAKLSNMLPVGNADKKDAPNVLLFTLERIQSGTSCFLWADSKLTPCLQSTDL